MSEGQAEGTVKKPVKRSTQEEFIAAWEGSSSAAEAATKLGVGTQSVNLRAKKFREEKGLPMKEMVAGSVSRINVNAGLTQLAEIRGCTVEELQAEAKATATATAEKIAAAKKAKEEAAKAAK